MGESAGELLSRAAAVFRASKARYRDAMVEVGSLLLQYLRARLAEGDGKNEAERREAKVTRSALLKAAGEALGVVAQSAQELIRVAAAVEILLPGGVGDLSYSALRAFRPLICRPNRGKIGRTKRAGYEDGLKCSDLEVWGLRQGWEEKGPALAREAVAGGWGIREIEVAIKLRGELPRNHGASPGRARVFTGSDREDAVPQHVTSSFYDRDELVDRMLSVALADDDPDGFLEAVAAALEDVRAGRRFLARAT